MALTDKKFEYNKEVRFQEGVFYEQMYVSMYVIGKIKTMSIYKYFSISNLQNKICLYNVSKEIF